MNTLLWIYLLGVAIVDLITSGLLFIDSYYQYMIDTIEYTKSSNDEYDKLNDFVEINNEFTLNGYVVIISLLSWLAIGSLISGLVDYVKYLKNGRKIITK